MPPGIVFTLPASLSTRTAHVMCRLNAKCSFYAKIVITILFNYEKVAL